MTLLGTEMADELRFALVVSRCLFHQDNLCLSLEDRKDAVGIRLTSRKCCGRWNTLYEFPVDAFNLREAVRAFEDAIDTIEQEIDTLETEG